MRGNVAAALVAAALIAGFAYWRIESRSQQEPVAADRLLGAWERAGSEPCAKLHPARLEIEADGGYKTPDGGGRWSVGHRGEVELGARSFRKRLTVYRIKDGMLEILDNSGCRAIYAPAE